MLHVDPVQPGLQTHLPVPPVVPFPSHVPPPAVQGAQGAHVAPAKLGKQVSQAAPPQPVEQTQPCWESQYPPPPSALQGVPSPSVGQRVQEGP